MATAVSAAHCFRAFTAYYRMPGASKKHDAIEAQRRALNAVNPAYAAAARNARAERQLTRDVALQEKTLREELRKLSGHDRQPEVNHTQVLVATCAVNPGDTRMHYPCVRMGGRCACTGLFIHACIHGHEGGVVLCTHDDSGIKC